MPYEGGVAGGDEQQSKRRLTGYSSPIKGMFEHEGQSLSFGRSVPGFPLAFLPLSQGAPPGVIAYDRGTISTHLSRPGSSTPSKNDLAIARGGAGPTMAQDRARIRIRRRSPSWMRSATPWGSAASAQRLRRSTRRKIWRGKGEVCPRPPIPSRAGRSTPSPSRTCGMRPTATPNTAGCPLAPSPSSPSGHARNSHNKLRMKMRW